jgi:hypothetical protein
MILVGSETLRCLKKPLLFMNRAFEKNSTDQNLRNVTYIAEKYFLQIDLLFVKSSEVYMIR